jgi:hypothetical protein
MALGTFNRLAFVCSALLTASCAASPTASPSRAPAATTTTVRSRPTTTVPATTTTLAPLALSALSRTLDLYPSTRSGTITLAVEDMRTGSTWVLNPHAAPQATASIVKVDILETLLYRTDVAHQTLTQEEQALATGMIEVSSNEDATALWDAAGGPDGIGAFNRLVGLTETTPSGCVECAGFDWPGWGLTTTTPLDQLRVLEQLVRPNSLLSLDAQRFELSLMSNIEPALKWGVSSGVPQGASVAMKTGDVPLPDGLWQVNSIGWVHGQVYSYLIAMMTTGNPSLEYGIDTLNELGQLLWAHLPSRPGSVPGYSGADTRETPP